MARVAHVLVVLGVARQRERVVPADRCPAPPPPAGACPGRRTCRTAPAAGRRSPSGCGSWWRPGRVRFPRRAAGRGTRGSRSTGGPRRRSPGCTGRPPPRSERAVAVSTRRSSTRVGQRRRQPRLAPAAAGEARRTSSTRSEGGLSASTDIGPPGAATTAVRRCRAVNSARVPAGDHSPNSATARAWPGSSPRADSGPMTAAACASDSSWPWSRARRVAVARRAGQRRSTVAAVSAAVPSAA